MRKYISWLIYILIGLAVVGFVGNLLTDTLGLLMNLFITACIGAVIFGLFYFFLMRPRSTNELKKYRKAVKQSKQKYKHLSHKQNGKQTFKPNMYKKSSALKSSRRNVPHLRVIEGNKEKEKKKNRASL
ncbi:SA1362 family protein [Gracilibacillus sp. YIM 98692]|uniref:SA1362 family protein n=1 Tax=Gracilibacillus sp. YIM 98692 TaxID=2663532 RepID=UPI0013D1A8A6|nr:SA1362 family protein [Gracilibacillus sp. YIM 98692]